MDLSLTEQQEAMKKVAESFVQQELPRELLLELEKTETGTDQKLWARMAEMGWLGLLIPEQYGGEGLGLMETAVVYEALGHGPLGGAHFSSSVLGAMAVMAVGTEQQRQEILPRVASGEQVLALALTEPNYGWGPESVQLRAERHGDTYSLSGVKLFVHDALAATHLLCVARTREEDILHGITVFLIDRTTQGVHVRNLSGFFGSVAEVRLQDVELPISSVLGQENMAWEPLGTAILRAIPILCAYQVGACQTVFDMTLKYSQTREAFGQPIGRFQRVQDHIIDIVNHLDGARWATYEAIWRLESNREPRASVHLAKVVASEAYHQACTSSHEVHAAIGTMHEYGLNLHTKTSRGLYHFLGDPAFHKKRLAEALDL